MIARRLGNPFAQSLALVLMLFIAALAPALSSEPIPGDSCDGYPAGAVMRSGGPELGGVTYVMSCSGGIWTAIQPNPDTTPDAFSFTDQSGVATSTLIESNTINITGIDTSTNISIAGDGSPEFRIDGGSWVTSGTITNGQTLQLRLTSNAASSTTNSATITVGTATDQWDVTTADGSSYVANAVAFDGSNDYLSKTFGLSGLADSTKFTTSFWFKLNAQGVDTLQVIFEGSYGRIHMAVDHGGTNNDLYNVYFYAADSSDSMKVYNETPPEELSPGNWYHVLFSADTSTGISHLYLNDALDEGYEEINSGTLDLTDPSNRYAFGAAWGGSQKFDGDIAEFWFEDGLFIDFSVEANRRKFIDASGKPVDLGADGSTPTGAAPLVFLSGDTSGWHTNKGTGGGFTENGALADASSSPSD